MHPANVQHTACERRQLSIENVCVLFVTTHSLIFLFLVVVCSCFRVSSLAVFFFFFVCFFFVYFFFFFFFLGQKGGGKMNVVLGWVFFFACFSVVIFFFFVLYCGNKGVAKRTCEV